MIALLIPFLVVSLGAGPVQFSGSASVYGEHSRVTGDPLVDPRAARQMRPHLADLRPMNRETYD